MSEFTHRYGDHENTAVLPPLGPPPGQEPPRKGRGGRGAGILAGALVLGLLGGVGGAAGYAALDDDPATSSSPSTRTVSPVRSGGDDSPAPDGSPEAVAAQVLPSVVKITVVGGSSGVPQLGGEEQQGGSGSGVIISSDGEILTNYHVVEVGGDEPRITVSFNDGSSASASVVGTDPLTDLAVIKADDVSGLTPAAIGDSDSLDVGEDVVAIGSPFGLQATVTSGIVSSLNRPVTVTGDSGDTTYPAIQTDAAINPGNSGGPLVNLAGEVVGINSSIRTASSGLGGEGGSIGLGFSIPISKVLPIVEQLRAGETPTHARLGVEVSNSGTEPGSATGAAVERVEEGSAADEAGLREGDVVTRVDDDVISDSESLVATIRGHRPDDEVTLTVVRGDETIELQATLDSDEGQQDQGTGPGSEDD
ncbi:S1C family serine protease [Nocardioides caldifontis]|uniref:S1C family serine protease n=1 Tax=Nocardioides caldifontis TaxID=2588938 RepID=UPI0011DF6A86|nr:trypsin-like peptidase domain-containing protein [Nocardioides caldifontis]